MSRTTSWGCLVLLGCGPGASDVPSYAAEIAPLVESRCLACHVGELAGGGLDLSGDARAAVVGVASTQAPEMLLVAPGDALYSYLWHKLNGSQSLAGGSGSSMPQGTFLADDEIALVAEWIDGGAAP